MDEGYRKVRPLAGGLEAWLEAGKPFEVSPGENGPLTAKEVGDARRR
jgi:3-mercaptopyruvate sulfurtransferase SseA